jgi:hypothetical protein
LGEKNDGSNHRKTTSPNETPKETMPRLSQCFSGCLLSESVIKCFAFEFIFNDDTKETAGVAFSGAEMGITRTWKNTIQKPDLKCDCASFGERGM